MEEPHHLWRQHGRVVLDAARLAQTGRWTGHINVAGRRFDVTPDQWRGSRDRSWGIRPVGEPEPPGRSAAREPAGFFWIYCPMSFANFSLLTIVQEETDGTRVLEEAVRVWPEYTGRPLEHLGRLEYELTFSPGTRTVERATLRLREPDGSPLAVPVEPLLPVVIGLGGGYGLEADWRHGMYQRPLKVESVTFDLADPAVQARFFGVVDTVARATVEGGPSSVNGAAGHGLFEYAVIGPHHPTGHRGWWRAHATCRGCARAPA